MVSIKAQQALKYIDEKSDRVVDLSKKIWEVAELALHEHESARYLAEALEDEGFRVEAGVAEMPTAFVATWGEGGPVIGILGEYDALAGMSQKPISERQELVPGGGGHACGHNLLGAGAFAGAIALKHQLETEELKATIKYFGCPAEENLSGKAFMARAGLFDDCDICLTWHPGTFNQVWSGSSLANNAANIVFHGQTAHAAGAPEGGRSALDAVQLMNMGVEFLREHVPDEARMHYAITDGGGQPNVVPDRAEVWYLVRAPERIQVDDIYRRVLRCASGAAEMTETTYDVHLLKAIYNLLPNRVLEDVLADSMRAVGPPSFDAKEHAFAREIASTFSPGQLEQTLKKQGLSADDQEKLQESPLHESVSDPRREDISGSTDVGDVSWCCPTAQFSAACCAIGTPGHSWQYTAQAGMDVGFRGMLTAGRVLAEAGYRLVTNPEMIRKARQEFEERTGGRKYVSAMPEDQKPAFEQFADRS